MPTENSVITREHLPGLLLARTIWENGGPSLYFPPALQDATDQARAALPAPASVPDGYMPIPTAEQLADALDGVRCYHDLGAELIAPELLANLLAVTSVKAEQVPTPEFVWVRLLEALHGDNGGAFTASTDDYREAKPALVQLIAAGFFRDDADSLDGDIWAVAAGEQGEAAARFASCPDAYAVLSDVLNRVFDRPDEAPSLPAAGSADLTAVRCQCCATEYPHDSYDAGFIAGSGMCQVCDAAMPPKDLPAAGSAVEEVEVVAWMWRDLNGDMQFNYMHPEGQELMTVAQHERIVAALSAQQSTPERTDGWISVSERLPDVAQEVIVDSEFDGVTAGFLDSYGEWYSPNSDYKLTRVVAWQPLPAAPSLLASHAEGGKV